MMMNSWRLYAILHFSKAGVSFVCWFELGEQNMRREMSSSIGKLIWCRKTARMLSSFCLFVQTILNKSMLIFLFLSLFSRTFIGIVIYRINIEEQQWWIKNAMYTPSAIIANGFPLLLMLSLPLCVSLFSFFISIVCASAEEWNSSRFTWIGNDNHQPE